MEIQSFIVAREQPRLCVFCQMFLLDSVTRWEGGMTMFKRDIEKMKLLAAQGCPTCAIFTADLILIDGIRSQRKRVKIFITSNDGFLYPGGDMDVLGGMNRTPLRYLLKDPNEVEHLFSTIPLAPNTDSETCFNQARAWLQTCREQHSCHPPTRDFTPTRLLEIDKHNQTIRLVENTETPRNVEYATLSHCWGQQMPHRLVKDTLGKLSNVTPMKSLGTTFRDACKVALELDLRYLWIDSLCIIQDSAEDWTKESNLMHKVYGNSTCTIAATAAANIDTGCFQQRNPDSLTPIKLRFAFCPFWEQEGGPSAMYLTNIGLWWDKFQRQPLLSRAWVVQERFLSPCVLHYDRDRIAWECQCLTTCEGFPVGMRELLQPHSHFFRSDLDGALDPTSASHAIPGWALSQFWRPTVMLYTLAGITKPSDRLIAIRGVGVKIEKLLGSTYVAGLFLKDAPSQLVWKVAAIGHSRIPLTVENLHLKPSRPKIPIAPSWSWAAIDGPIDLMPQWDSVEELGGERAMRPEDLQERALCEVLSVHHGDSEAERAGLVSQAKLEICCYMTQVAFTDLESAIKLVSELRKGSHDAVLKDVNPIFDLKSTRARGNPSSRRRLTRGPNNDIIELLDNGHRLRDRNTFSKVGSIKLPQIPPDERTFWAKMEWDIWSEFDIESIKSPESALWLIPIHTVVKSYPVDIWEKEELRIIRGLIVQHEPSSSPNTAMFRRLGTFSLENRRDEQSVFWIHTLQCPAIDGVDLVRRSNVWTAVLSEKEWDEDWDYGENPTYELRDNVSQYRITLI